MKYIEQHPILTLRHGLHKIYSLYQNDTNSVWYSVHVAIPRLTWIYDVISNTGYGIFMALAALGLVVLVVTRSHGRLLALPLLWVVYNTLLFMFFPAWDRFRYPMMPMYALLLGVGVAWLIWRQGAFSKSRRAPAVTPG